MRLASLAIACLALASTAAAGSISTAAPVAKPVCSTNLQKVDKAAGYKVVRQCAGNLNRAGQPVVDGLGQDEGSDRTGTTLVVAAAAAGVIGGGLLILSNSDSKQASP